MASTNQLYLNVYQINQDPVVGGPVRRGIPTEGALFIPLTGQVIQGIQVYSLIWLAAGTGSNQNPALFFVAETVQQLVTMANS